MESSRMCVICFCGVCQADWTKNFNTVFLRNRGINVGFLRFNKDVSLQESRDLATPDQRTRFRLNPSPYFTSVDAFLIHTSCYLLLREFGGSGIGPHQAFKLCQAIQPDRERNFGYDWRLNSSVCPDPSMSIRPRKCLPQSKETALLLQPDKAGWLVSHLLKLPSEILTTILEYLSPSDLIRFFRASKETLSYANLFCRTNPLHFYRCSTTTIMNREEDKRILMIAFSAWARFSELDRRWEIVERAARIARLLPFLDLKIQVVPTFDPRAPLQAVNHQFGLYQSFINIPDHTRIVQVCSIGLEGKLYVCGIGFVSTESELFLGVRTKSIREFDVSDMLIETIGLAADELGITSIKYGASPWLFGDPASSRCWAGFSLRQKHTRIRVVRDALKFRDISWHYETPPSFEETILMRNKHPSLSSHKFIDETLYVQQHPDRERELVNKFGRFPVETLWFEQGLQAIRIYGAGGLEGIRGLSAQTLSDTFCVGVCHTDPASITLDAPHEILSEIDVRTSELYPLAVTNQL